MLVGSVFLAISPTIGRQIAWWRRPRPTLRHMPSAREHLSASTDPDQAEVAIRLRSVTKAYGESVVVDDLNLDVPTGQMVALVGPSGCGKTTTLRMINRLIEPTSGQVMVFGQDAAAVPAHELRRHIGYVIQHVGLFPHLTIARNIAVVPELLGWDRDRIRTRTDELVELVGLQADVLDRYPSALSGGQQQRVGVARALAADPPVLLMDEPFSAVDPIVRERLQDDLLALQTRVNKTIVIVTHDIDEAIRLGDRVAIMQTGGVLAQYDTPDEILRQPANTFVAEFLGRERGLRRLSLLTVADVEVTDGPVVADSATTEEARGAAERFGTHWVAITTDGKLSGWVPLEALDHGGADVRVGSLEPVHFHTWVTPSTPLREALDVIVTSNSRTAVVLDHDQETLLGFVDIGTVAGGLE